LGLVLDNGSLEVLLDKAKESEKKYEWLHAADIYCKVSDSVLEKNDFLKAGGIQDFIGFCYFKAALQAETKPQFNDRMKLAGQFYERAANLFGNSEEIIGIIRADNSKAWSVYCNAWLETAFLKKRQLLNEWWNLKSKVLREYREIGNQIAIAKTCNDMIEGSIDCRYWLGSNWDASRQIKEELISLGETAIQILTRVENDYELARAYCWTSWICLIDNGTVRGNPDEIEKGITYSERALVLSNKTKDAWLIGWSSQTAFIVARLRNILHLATDFLENSINQGIWPNRGRPRKSS